MLTISIFLCIFAAMNRLFCYILATFLGITFPNLTYAQQQAKASGSGSAETAYVTNAWGVKTNLLYDSYAFVNLGLERNIGRSWGISAEAICPWFNSEDNYRTTQVMDFGLEGRYYWKGWTENDKPLSGPYIGLHCNVGRCDIARDFKGTQCERFIMGGPVIGYSGILADNWRINLTFGLGYMNAKYKHYHIIEDGEILYPHYSGTYSYVGPTKVEASIVWLFYSSKK